MNKYIIIAEDNQDHADLIMLSLKNSGLEHEVVHLSDGKEVLDFLNAENEYSDRIKDNLPDLLLLDVRMPKLDGLEILTKLRSDNNFNSIPIVMMTSSENSKDINDAYSNGANSYIIKPVEFSELNDLLRKTKIYWLDINRTPLKLVN